MDKEDTRMYGRVHEICRPLCADKAIKYCEEWRLKKQITKSAVYDDINKWKKIYTNELEGKYWSKGRSKRSLNRMPISQAKFGRLGFGVFSKKKKAFSCNVADMFDQSTRKSTDIIPLLHIYTCHLIYNKAVNIYSVTSLRNFTVQYTGNV